MKVKATFIAPWLAFIKPFSGTELLITIPTSAIPFKNRKTLFFRSRLVNFRVYISLFNGKGGKVD